MKSIVTIILLSICSSGLAQTCKHYFFEDLTITDSTSLVLIIDNPQTKFAQDLNHRIFTDTNFLNELKQTWYYEDQYPPGRGRTYHDCGHDMYFYLLVGTELKLLQPVNSKCSEYDIGKANLRRLAESGKTLHVDTLTRIPLRAYPEDLFTTDFIGFLTDGDTKRWDITRNNRFPEIYYDGYFKTKIVLDTALTVEQNAEKFVRIYTENMVGVNWNIVTGRAIWDFEMNKTPTEVEIEIYLTRPNFDYFKRFTLTNVKFSIPFGSSLMLMYRN